MLLNQYTLQHILETCTFPEGNFKSKHQETCLLYIRVMLSEQYSSTARHLPKAKANTP